jgi:hypothetical protein
MVLQAQEWTHRVSARLTEVERADIDRAVAASGLTLSEWVRDAFATAAAAQDVPPAPAQKPVKAPAKLNPFMEAVRRVGDAEPRAR